MEVRSFAYYRVEGWLGEGHRKEGRTQIEEGDEASQVLLEVWVHRCLGSWGLVVEGRDQDHLSDTGPVFLHVSCSRHRSEGEDSETKTQVAPSSSIIPTA